MRLHGDARTRERRPSVMTLRSLELERAFGFVSPSRRTLPFGYCPKGKVRVDTLVGILSVRRNGMVRSRPPASVHREQALKYGYLLAATSALGLMALPLEASAGACVNGVYRAGCAGPNGAVAVRK